MARGGHQKKVKAEEILKVKKGAAEGKTIYELSAETNRDPRTIWKIINGEMDDRLPKPKQESVSTYADELVPKTDNEKFFVLSSSLSALETELSQMLQQNDEIIDLLKKLVGAWCDERENI